MISRVEICEILLQFEQRVADFAIIQNLNDFIYKHFPLILANSITNDVVLQCMYERVGRKILRKLYLIKYRLNENSQNPSCIFRLVSIL